MDKSVRFSNAWDYVATLELDEFYRFTISMLNIDLPYGGASIKIVQRKMSYPQKNV